MRLLPFALLLGVLIASAPSYIRAEEESEPPLPKWLPEELEAMRAAPNLPPVLGELLGGLEVMGEAPAATPLLLGQESEILVDSPDRTQPSTDLSRFLPPSLLKGTRTHSSDQITLKLMASLKEVPQAFLRDCEDQAAGSHLIDPNHELSEPTAEDFERFLAFHARDSRIPLTLVILGRSQKLPANANLSAFASGSVGRGPSALLIYPYGEPWRSHLFVSQSVREGVAANLLNDLLENGIREGLRATDPDEQLHRLLVQVSTRLFWAERALASPTSPPPVTPPTGLKTESPPMAEITAPQKSTAGKASRWGVASVLLLLVALGVLCYGAWRWRRFKMQHYEWILPVKPEAVAQRFGGPYCGGGVSIHYR